jgi:hypothetical protein
MRGIFGPLVTASAVTILTACVIETEDGNQESATEPDDGETVSSILAGPRPLFQLPFPCGQRWLAQTRADHKPNPNSLDMFMVGGGENGQPILAAFAGRVVRARLEGTAGNFVRIDHGGGWQTRYLHMIRLPVVREGQQVTQGQLLGHVGSTGDSGAPHLHFEQMQDDITVRSAFNGQLVTVEVGRSQTLTSLNCGRTLPRIAVDYDGDGRADLAVWRPAEGNWWLRPSASAASVTQWGLPGDIPMPADYDGDGRGDLAVWRPAEGNWYIDRSSTTNPSVTQWGLPGDIPVPADYDGDGLADLGIWRPADGNWWIDRSTTTNPSVTQWGLPGDIPVPADYDGDGLADLGVWRPADGNWWIDRSTTTNPSVTQWGQPGDIPLPADFDGDGLADLGIWRPAEGNWYIKRSTSPTPTVTQWGLPGDIPVP